MTETRAKAYWQGLGLALVFLLLAGCTQAPAQQGGKAVVLATFFPLYDFTQKVVGDTTEVRTLVPAGVEPHDYEPTPQDLLKAQQAQAFVTMGLEFASLEEKTAQAMGPSMRVIDAAKGIPLRETGGMKDPHIWLSPKKAAQMLDNIAAGLKETYPGNAERYEENRVKASADLKALDQDFKKGLARCGQDTILVSHNAFSYLADDYGFKTLFISGLEPEAEPEPEQLADLIDAAKREKLKYIFYEELVDPTVSETIAREAGLQTMRLSPLEGTKDPDADYLSLMRENLGNLKLALECG